MATAVQKITLSASRDIPFDKLVLSQTNVRRTKAGVSIDELAEDIARRTLLQSLSVRPVLDAAGVETGIFEVPAGGRRYRALELLVKQKRLAKTALVPCVVREATAETSGEEDSLAENLYRIALPPLDEFRAFKRLSDQGLDEEQIAVRYATTPMLVKQRLRLAAASPKLLDIYGEDGMTLQQLMAFTVTNDHTRQERVWEGLAYTSNKEPYYIRRQLTEGAVRAADRRALFIGAEAYEAAGGVILRDLFEQDDGGWLQDPALLDSLVTEKLKLDAEALAAEGWKWIAVGIEFPYGHTNGLRRLIGQTVGLTDDEHAAREALRAEFEQLEAQYAEADELPDDVDQRLGEIETALEAFESRPVVFEPAEISRAGAFVSVAGNASLLVERGFVRPEDEAPAEPSVEDEETGPGQAAEPSVQRAVITIGGASSDEPEGEEEDTLRPLSDRLVTELTVHRTVALRDAVAQDPHVAFQAVLHALCLTAFYRHDFDTCLEITGKSSSFSAQAPGLSETASAKSIEARHEQWRKQLPEKPADLWDALTGFDGDSQAALFAHCAALTVNVVREPWNHRLAALAHGDQVARAVDLDMVAAGWRPTVDTYLGRVPKLRILEAVREAKGEQSAQLIDHLKKADMAKEAERLLEGTGWLPEPLRVIRDAGEGEPSPTGEYADTETLPAFLADDEESTGQDDAEQPAVIAAE